MKHFERINYNKVPNKVTRHIYTKTMFYKIDCYCPIYFVSNTQAVHFHLKDVTYH